MTSVSCQPGHAGQQLSAPTAAKSVEDTAFYRYGRLISRNEVGTEPDQFAITPAAFHAAQALRARHAPRALLATATHDHKRGEDARMRLAVLSEIPEEWEAALARWMRLNAPLKRDLDGPAPDAADEIMLYQTLVGAWPLGLTADQPEALAAFEQRVTEWQEKALREAKRHSGWAAPNVEYEQACRDFLHSVLDPARAAQIVQDMAAFAARLARPGAINSLAQTLLRLTCPGVPDLYQGCEFWDFSLVDPDNRRPVDFAARQAALDRATGRASGENPASVADLLASWEDGRIKQALIHQALSLRARAPGLFGGGRYIKLRCEGALCEHILAFGRVQEGRGAIVLATRQAAKLPGTDGAPVVATAAWKDTCVILPSGFSGRTLVDALGGAPETRWTTRLFIHSVLQRLPVALLEVQ